MKMNNIVWTCCVFHNLLLGIDGLDKLWTAEDYLSTWCVCLSVCLFARACVCVRAFVYFLMNRSYRYANPDLDHHELFDIATTDHDAIIQRRADSRRRQFSASRLGTRRPSLTAAPHTGEGEEVTLQGDAGTVAAADTVLPLPLILLLPDPVEWDDNHVRRREELVLNFQLGWDAGETEWLAMPGTRHDSRRSNCN